ncbi:MAG TPA: hypothetical protein VGC66_21950 [Pyrinomonadaceae bacterium]|jgi:hypothetical protein
MTNALTIVGTIASVIGLFISIYLLYNVKKLTDARREEREFMKKVLLIEELDYEIKNLIELFNSDKPFDGCEATATRLAELRGKVIGALMTVDELYGGYGERYTAVLTGYYTVPFFNNFVSKGKKEVKILSFHNRRFSDYGILEILTERANYGCKITILSLSFLADNHILELTREKLPMAPNDLNDFKREIKNNALNTIKFFDARVELSKKQNISYRLYTVLPRVHLVQVDDFLYVEFVSYDPESIVIKYEAEQVCPYLIVPVNTPLGRFLLEQFNYVYRTSEPIEDLLVKEPDTKLLVGKH